MTTRRWLISPRYDFGWFALPGIVAFAAGLALGLAARVGALGDEAGHLPIWILGVLLVDVAHVYASLYRTYLDPGARERHAELLIFTPLFCFCGGFLLHLASPLYFWMVLAYIAVFHFIKQHVGFALLYSRAMGEGRGDRLLTEAAVWAGTLGPVLYWHAHLPRQFAWFSQQAGFAPGLPAWIGDLALLVSGALLAVFALRRIQLASLGRHNPMACWMTALPALNWHLGIVWFNDDRVFTVTNVFLHGIPYFALVWATGGRPVVERALSPLAGRLSLAARTLLLAAAFYVFLALLAAIEEALWDALIWHDKRFFGSVKFAVGSGSAVEALVVALLTVPQATHYVLDRFIWRVGESNPELAGQLGFEQPRSV